MRKVRNTKGSEIALKIFGWVILSLFILFCQVGCLINYVINFFKKDKYDT